MSGGVVTHQVQDLQERQGQAAQVPALGFWGRLFGARVEQPQRLVHRIGLHQMRQGLDERGGRRAEAGAMVPVRAEGGDG